MFGGEASAGGLPKDITAVIARPDGSVWLASQNNGIVILGADGKPQRTIAMTRVSCLAAEADRPVYIGTRSGLFVASPSGDQIRRVEIASSRLDAGISSLAKVDNAVWVGGVAGNGLWELHPATNGSVTVARHFDTPTLPNATIHEVRPTHDGLLAIGTAGRCLIPHRLLLPSVLEMRAMIAKLLLRPSLRRPLSPHLVRLAKAPSYQRCKSVLSNSANAKYY